MRLSEEEINLLKASVKELDSNAEIFLFGSRVHDDTKGGDIDLLIISKILDKKKIRLLKHKFFETFGEQKIDIVIDNGELKDPFIKKVFPKAVSL